MARPLDAHSRKRDFTATLEPRGAVRPEPGPVLHYVIQKHGPRQLHYDFRLEFDGTFKRWAVHKDPCQDPGIKRLAVQVEDHSLDYPRAGYAQGRLRFELQGAKLGAAWNLVRTAMVGKKAQCFLIKARDGQARDLGECDIRPTRSWRLLPSGISATCCRTWSSWAGTTPGRRCPARGKASAWPWVNGWHPRPSPPMQPGRNGKTP